MQYNNALKPIENPLPILADHPRYIEPLQCERRFLAPPVVDEPGANLTVRAWRYWYNARGIIEMENRLEAKAADMCVIRFETFCRIGGDDVWIAEPDEVVKYISLIVKKSNELLMI